MLAVRHLPWPVALLLALATLLMLAGWLTGGAAPVPPGAPVGVADGPPSSPRVWVEIGSNRMEVWERLQREADLLALGQEMTPAERGRCVKALALALSLDDLELARPYTDPLRVELRLEQVRHLGEEVSDVLARLDERTMTRALYQSRGGRPAGLTVGGWRIEVGFATYHNWRTTVTATRVDRREQREPLPDTYQPYVWVRMVLQ